MWWIIYIYVMYEIDHVLLIGITTCMSMSMTTGRSHRSCLNLLYATQSPCNCFTLSLSGHDSCRSNSWQDDNDASMEIKVSSRWWWWSWWCFGDGDQRHKMMMAISCHIFWLHVMFIFYASYFAQYDGCFIRWSLTKISRYKCSPWVCIIATVHRAETPCYDRVW